MCGALASIHVCVLGAPRAPYRPCGHPTQKHPMAFRVTRRDTRPAHGVEVLLCDPPLHERYWPAQTLAPSPAGRLKRLLLACIIRCRPQKAKSAIDNCKKYTAATVSIGLSLFPWYGRDKKTHSLVQYNFF